jgi:hypothetical protein
LQLDPREELAQALVNTVAEGDMGSPWASEVQLPGCCEHVPVMIGGIEHAQHAVAGIDELAADGYVFNRDAGAPV